MNNQMFQYIGCGLCLLFIIYIVFSFSKYQFSMIEGLTNISSNSADTAAIIKDQTTKTLDTLLINKYRSNYEDIIVNMNDWCDAQILNIIVSGEMDCKNGCSEKFMASVKKVNNLENFKKTLNDSIGYLDNQ